MSIEKMGFERAIFDGSIQGPDWQVVDSDTSEIIDIGNQNFSHMQLGREVRSQNNGTRMGYVLDFQFPNHSQQDSQREIHGREFQRYE